MRNCSQFSHSFFYVKSLRKVSYSMYIDNGVNWRKELLNKKIFIFGAGKQGYETYEKLKLLNPNVCIAGIIDNNKNVVDKFNSGKGWVEHGFLPKQYEQVANIKNDLIIVTTDFYKVKQQLIDLGLYNSINYFDIDLSTVGENHYNKNYFKTQLEFAKVDSVLDKDFFQNYIKETDDIAEFGSGGGLLLGKLKCRNSIGIEINEVARQYAISHGINSVNNIEELQDESIDVVISTHALEHCLEPYKIVSEIKNKIKAGGKFICVVPYEPLSYGYMLNDFSMHLYNWTERTLGNLLRTAGFYIRETGTKEVAWPQEWRELFEKENTNLFKVLSVLESDRTGYYSVYAVGEK